jgi:hypothetical protein
VHPAPAGGHVTVVFGPAMAVYPLPATVALPWLPLTVALWLLPGRVIALLLSPLTLAELSSPPNVPATLPSPATVAVLLASQCLGRAGRSGCRRGVPIPKESRGSYRSVLGGGGVVGTAQCIEVSRR